MSSYLGEALVALPYDGSLIKCFAIFDDPCILGHLAQQRLLPVRVGTEDRVSFWQTLPACRDVTGT